MVEPQTSQASDWVTVAQYAEMCGVCPDIARREINDLRALHRIPEFIPVGNVRGRQYHLPSIRAAKLKVAT